MLNNIYFQALSYFTKKGIPKSIWLYEYTLKEVIDLVIEEGKAKIEERLLHGESSLLPVIAMGGEEGGETVSKYINDLYNLLGVDNSNKKNYNHFESINKARSNLGMKPLSMEEYKKMMEENKGVKKEQ